MNYLCLALTILFAVACCNGFFLGTYPAGLGFGLGKEMTLTKTVPMPQAYFNKGIGFGPAGMSLDKGVGLQFGEGLGVGLNMGKTLGPEGLGLGFGKNLNLGVLNLGFNKRVGVPLPSFGVRHGIAFG